MRFSLDLKLLKRSIKVDKNKNNCIFEESFFEMEIKIECG